MTRIVRDFFNRLASAQDVWLWRDVALPMLATRAGLLLVGYFSQMLAIDPRFPYDLDLYSRFRLLDIWARWDSSWYLQIARHGYTVQGDVWTVTSSIAFFPLYPLLVRVLAWPFGLLEKQSALLLIGIVLSNLFLFGALALLYRLAVDLFSDPAVARRAVLFTLAFPAGFYASGFYTESVFLFFSLGAFIAAHRQQWALAGACGFLAALARPVGVLLVLPLAWLYLEAPQRKPGPDAIRSPIESLRTMFSTEILWLLLPPAGLFAYLLAVLPLTGDLLAPFKIQSAWGKIIAFPWQTIANPVWYDPFFGIFQKASAIAALLLTALAFRKLPHKAYGLYSLLLILPPLTSGTLASFARYMAVIFPFFLALAAGKNGETLERWIVPSALMLQGLLFAGWAQHYPVF